MSGVLFACLWGLAGGIVTTIPLGPTGALVLVHASNNDRRSVFQTILGFSAAHLLLQLIYHIGLSHLIQSQDHVIRILAIPGVAMMAILGLSFLRRARKQYLDPSLLLLKPNQERAYFRGPFARSFVLAMLNPVLLVWMVANVAMFLEFLPAHRNDATIRSLLFATLLGTVLYYGAFGFWVARRSGSWSPRKRALAEGFAGLIMIFAGMSLAWRL